MRKTFLILAWSAALLLSAGLGSSQSIPDAPQPQKKPAPKAQPASPDSSESAPAEDNASAPAQPATKNDNAFPEDVSRAAAEAVGNSEGSHAPASDTQASPQADNGKSVKDDNAFPEDISRAAAKAAQDSKKSSENQIPSVAPESDLPPGESSSQSSSSLDTVDVPAHVVDPARSKKDIDVGSFYLKTGDYQGALLRYKDATASDPANVEAIFGLAETQRMLKNNAEAVRNYEMYLAILPDGPRAKQSLKALKTLQPGH